MTEPTNPTLLDSEITTRLRLAKILKDYKDETVDYIRTSEAIENLLLEARIDELRRNLSLYPEDLLKVNSWAIENSIKDRLLGLQEMLK